MKPGAVVVCQQVAKNQVVRDCFLEKQSVAAIALADVEQNIAINGMGIHINAILLIPHTCVANDLNLSRHMQPDAAPAGICYGTTLDKERTGGLSALGANAIADCARDIHAVN